MTSKQKPEQDERQELLRQQIVLSKFGELALKSEDLDEILTEACRLIGEALGTDLAKVMELGKDGVTLRVRAGVGWQPGVVGIVEVRADRGSSEGYALRTGEPMVSSDINREERFRYPQFLMDRGVKAVVNVIIIGGRDRPPFGILQVDSRTPREFTEQDITFLRGYANLLAAAVDRLRVLGEVRTSRDALEATVAERTHELVAANAKLRAEAAERERVAKALAQASQMETVVEHLPIGAGLVSASGQILVANPWFRRLLPGQLIPSLDPRAAKSWSAVHPDGRPVEPCDFPGARALRGEVALNLDILRKDATIGDRWLRVSGIPIFDQEGHVAAALLVVVDVDEEKRAADRQKLLTLEVDHRAKNMLAVVQAALHLTRASDVAGFVRAIEGRVAALARAQTLLAADRWSGADLGALLRGELAAFLNSRGTGPRVELLGPPTALPPGAAQPLSMAIHELATNAVKYGALSVPEGHLFIRWQVNQTPKAVLHLRWEEAGGPALEGAPSRRGFGSRVLQGTLRDQLGGSVTTIWAPSGLVCEMTLPLDRAARVSAASGLAFRDEDGALA